MDSERRHELDENALRRALGKSPEFFREHGTKLLLGLAAIAVLFWVFQTRRADTERRIETGRAALYEMNQFIARAKQSRQFAVLSSPEDVAREQEEIARDFNANFALVTDLAGSSAQAHALRLQGDLYWVLGTFPEPMERPAPPDPEAEGAPATGEPRSADQWLDEARDSYQRLVQQFPDKTQEYLAALFGLAAIAEERGQFDEARDHYDRIIESPRIPPGPQEIARERRGLLDYLVVDARLPSPDPEAAPRDLLGPDISLDELLPPGEGMIPDPAGDDPADPQPPGEPTEPADPADSPAEPADPPAEPADAPQP